MSGKDNTYKVETKPLAELSQMIRQGKTTCKQMLQYYLDRIQKYDGPSGLNAYITVAEEQAFKQAEELDQLCQKNKFVGLLHGMPIALKDNVNTKGIRTTGGTKFLADWHPREDAHVVRKLKKAGAIILGKTNMCELASDTLTHNPHYGPTHNPYDFSCISGGSSGGSGAAVAADLCAAAIGSDTGGSIRIPSALCGVVGLKPTFGRVGRGGFIYLSSSMDVLGPITRTVEDAAIVLECIAGPDSQDPESSTKSTPEYRKWLSLSALEGKRLGVPKNYFFEDIHPETEAIMAESIQHIEKAGATVREVKIKHLDPDFPIGFNIFLPEIVYTLKNYLQKVDPELNIEKCLDLMGPVAKELFGSQVNSPVPGYVYLQALRDDRKMLITEFKTAMSGLDGLVMATTPLPATKIGEEDEETFLCGKKVNTTMTFIRNTSYINLIGYPAISVPAGYSSEGLPIGVQFVVRPWEEGQLLGMAHAFEQRTMVCKTPNLTHIQVKS